MRRLWLALVCVAVHSGCSRHGATTHEQSDEAPGLTLNGEEALAWMASNQPCVCEEQNRFLRQQKPEERAEAMRLAGMAVGAERNVSAARFLLSNHIVRDLRVITLRRSHEMGEAEWMRALNGADLGGMKCIVRGQGGVREYSYYDPAWCSFAATALEVLDDKGGEPLSGRETKILRRVFEQWGLLE